MDLWLYVSPQGCGMDTAYTFQEKTWSKKARDWPKAVLTNVIISIPVTSALRILDVAYLLME